MNLEATKPVQVKAMAIKDLPATTSHPNGRTSISTGNHKDNEGTRAKGKKDKGKGSETSE